MKTVAQLTRTVLKSELISDELMKQLVSETGRFLVMDDISSEQSLFAERPPGIDYWWYSINNGWNLILQTDQYGVNDQYIRIGR